MESNTTCYKQKKKQRKNSVYFEKNPENPVVKKTQNAINHREPTEETEKKPVYPVVKKQDIIPGKQEPGANLSGNPYSIRGEMSLKNALVLYSLT